MLSAQFHKKTKPQNSNCKAASAALSGFAFHQGVPGWRSHESPGGAFDRPNRSALCADAIRRFRAARLQPSALHLPPCSDFAMLRSSCRTFVFLCHSRFGKKFRKASAVGTGPRPLCLGSGPPGDVPPEEGILPRQTTPCSFPGTSENVCSHSPHVRQISAGSLHGPVSATLPSVTLLRSSTSCVGADIRPSQRTGWIPSLWDRCVRGPGASGGNFRMPHIPAATKRSQSFDEGNGADSADAVITFRGARTTASRLWEERSKGPLSASQARRGQKRCPGQKPVL